MVSLRMASTIDPGCTSCKHMSGQDTPILFFAPFVSSTMAVERDWIDYNGHMNLAYYHVLFDRAIDEAFSLVGIGPEYLAQRRHSCFVAEAHIRYVRELMLRDPVRVTVQLVDFDEKRLHYFMELRHARDGWLAATSENMSLHVNMDTRRVVPFPADLLANLAIMKATHSQMPKPEALGRSVAIQDKRQGASVHHRVLN